MPDSLDIDFDRPPSSLLMLYRRHSIQLIDAALERRTTTWWWLWWLLFGWINPYQILEIQQFIMKTKQENNQFRCVGRFRYRDLSLLAGSISLVSFHFSCILRRYSRSHLWVPKGISFSLSISFMRCLICLIWMVSNKCMDSLPPALTELSRCWCIDQRATRDSEQHIAIWFYQNKFWTLATDQSESRQQSRAQPFSAVVWDSLVACVVSRFFALDASLKGCTQILWW